MPVKPIRMQKNESISFGNPEGRKPPNKDFLPNWHYILTNPFFITRRYLYNNILATSKHIRGGKLLDIGCGSKPYEGFFKVDEYIGLDYNKEGANQNPNADAFYDGGKFPFKKGEFDHALATEVLEHVFEPDFFLQEIHRVLKPGGLCLLTVPFIWDEHEQPYDFGRYTSFGIRALLERNGFQVVEQKKTGNFITTLGQLLCTYLYYVLSRHRIVYRLSLPLIFAPIQLVALVCAKILPANDGFYLDNIVLCRKI